MVQRHSGSAAPTAAPDAEELHRTALAYLARYAAPRRALLLVLHRRIDRWLNAAKQASPDRDDEFERDAAAARAEAEALADRLQSSGVLSDAGFAEGRSRSLRRSGKSRAGAIAALVKKGVERSVAEAAVPDSEDAEMAAALLFARRKRIGPFRPERNVGAETFRRELAILARAGFSRTVAHRALQAEPAEAERLLAEAATGN